jgi:hypothetical protein
MAVQRRNNILSQERIDCPAFRSIESAASADFDTFIQALVTGAGNPYVINGFAINFSNNPIGGAASNLQVVVASGSLLATTASQSGTFYLVPAGTPNVVLNAATTSNVSGSFVPSSFNYVGLDYYRFQDPATDQQLALWDPTANDEDQIIAPAAIILNYEFVISTSIWAANILPIAIVETDSSNNVVSITDSRPLLFRLGTGGVDPNPFYVYPFPEGTTENPVTSTSNGSNPFYGGDKAITDLKDWIDAVETLLLDIGGGPYWYSYAGSAPLPNGSIPQLREDATNTILTSNGNISHGVIPDASPILTTTGNTTLGSNQITALASTTGIVSGQYIDGEAFYAGTTVLGVSGSTVTMSGEATDTTTGTTVSFTNPVATQPGQMNWSNILYLKIIGSNLEYQIAANPTGSTVVLADGQVAYIQLTRDITITPELTWTGGSPTVVSVGDVTWTTGLVPGDWITITTAGHAGYYEIETVNNAYTVTLTTNYGGLTTSAPSLYAYGEYTLPGVSGNSRDIQIAARGSVPVGPNYFWLFSRNDDGGALPRVYVRWLGMDLSYGVSENVSGPQIQNVLTYIGSPIESATAPQYVSSYNVWLGDSNAVLPQVVSITTGAASTMASNQYFVIYSSASSREYVIWVNKDGTGVDPTPIASAFNLAWVVTTGQTAAQTAATLQTLLNSTFYKDFSVSVSSNVLTVTNTSAGVTASPSNYNVGTPFAISVTQAGTGSGNYLISDSDNLTLAVKKLDEGYGVIVSSLDSPTYDETVDVVASGGTYPPSLTNPVTINGPVANGSFVTLPNNSREGNVAQFYTVGKGILEVLLNGQFIDVESGAYVEVGPALSPSNQIQLISFPGGGLVVGDELQFRFSGAGGSAGSEGPQGPPGPAGPAGATGANAAGGPVAISTKTSSYAILTTDCFLMADCTGGNIVFTLPVSSGNTGRIFYATKIDSSANTLTVTGNGSDFINEASMFIMAFQDQEAGFICTGSGWRVF